LSDAGANQESSRKSVVGDDTSLCCLADSKKKLWDVGGESSLVYTVAEPLVN